MSEYGEPWKISQKTSNTMSVCVEKDWGHLKPADAATTERIVTCINACEGIPNEKLLTGISVKEKLGSNENYPLTLSSTTVLKCPFCESDIVHIVVNSNDDSVDGTIYIRCKNCGATGPHIHCKDLTDINIATINLIKALTSWNDNKNRKGVK